jgi:hypothetical protein
VPECCFCVKPRNLIRDQWNVEAELVAGSVHNDSCVGARGAEIIPAAPPYQVTDFHLLAPDLNVQ